MNDFENQEKVDAEGVFSKVLRAGRRTYFFDVRETRAGDYYLTITESKKNTQDDGNVYYTFLKGNTITIGLTDPHTRDVILGENVKYRKRVKAE